MSKITLKEINDRIIKKYPVSLKEKWDECGILCNFEKNNVEVTGILVCLDVDSEAIKYAKQNSLNVIISHHPLFKKEDDGSINKDSINLLDKLKSSNIALLSHHTNVDNSHEGLSYYIAKKLNLGAIKHIPNTSIVIGTFKNGQRIRVLSDQMSRLFEINRKSIFNEKRDKVTSLIKSVAICAGSGFKILKNSLSKIGKVDLMITGDIKWHDWVFAKEHDLNLLDIGHDIENIFSEVIINLINSSEDIENVRGYKPSEEIVRIVE